MATPVRLRSREQILGDLIRTIAINTDITAFTRGSDVVTMLEGISEAISQTEASALKIIESIDINNLVGAALDNKALSSRIPNNQGGFGRKPALQASGPIVVGSSFAKVSSKLYGGKPAPFAGSLTLNVEDAQNFPATGSVYVGRGTLNRFEGPIPYSTVVNNGSFWTITLTQPLTKSHLRSDVVTLSQGGDRTVSAGTVVQILANSDSPPINFTTSQDLLIPDGEDEGKVNVIAQQFGESGNALAGSINSFTTAPFPGATVRNSTTFRNGQSTESDEDLRQRIKNYPATLSRGTDLAIKSAIQGAVDPDSGRSIQSSAVLAPVEPGDFARVFIDDGTGLEPTFDNQASELLLRSAEGQETRFRTAQFPITASVAEGSESAPFILKTGMTLSVTVDDIFETYTITPSNYRSLSSASAYEIVRDLNAQSNTVGFRTTNEGTRIVAIDLSGEAERLQFVAGDLQELLGFSLAELRPVFLYRNTDLLSFRGKTATLETRPRNEWNVTAPDLQDIRVLVDNVIQTFSINDSDFSEFGTNIATATVSEWATVFGLKIAGVKFTLSGQVIVWSTYNDLSPTGKLQILETKADGTPAGWIADDKIWLSSESGGSLSDVGFAKDYNFNRFSGEITLQTKPNPGDSYEIASRDTRALVRSSETTTGLFTMTPIATTIGNSKLIVGFDGSFAIRDVAVSPGTTFTPTQPDATGATNIIRATVNNTGVFLKAEIGDYFYVLPDVTALSAALPADAEGFYRIIARGYGSTEIDVAYPGLLGSATVFAGLPIETTLDSSIVKVNFTDHGLKTSDLITITTATDVGGILAANLTVVDAVVTVLNSNQLTYVAGTAATSSTTGFIDTFGSNLVTVTHTAHGFGEGALITVVAGASIGGISIGDLSVTSSPVEVITVDSYKFRAASAATATEASVAITTTTLLADTWVEFEVSEVQLTTWTTMLSTAHGLTGDMLYLFRSFGATPQLVDFGPSVSDMTVDDIVAAINNQIASGTAVKVSPQRLEVHSNKYDKTGTCAVLASIGNASNAFTAATSAAIQAHVAYSESAGVRGSAPVIQDVVNPTASLSGYPTRTYLKTDKNITNIITEDASPAIESPTAYNSVYPVGFQHLWITGRGEGYSARVYNNQTTAPYNGIITGSNMIRPLNTFDDLQTSPDSLDRYANIGMRVQDLPVNNYDSLVVEMDLQPTDRTVNIPMAKLAEIQDIDAIAGSGKGQVISFRLLDPEDSNKPFFDTTSIYKDFDFADFKILTRSVGLYREDASDRALIVRSYDYGAASQLRFSIRFPTQPDQADLVITHSNDFLNDRARLNLIAVLPSDSLIVGTTLGSGVYKVTATANGTIYDWRISGATFNSSSLYVAGNVLNIYGASNLSGGYLIKDASYASYATPSASVASGSNVVTVNIIAHGFEDGDLVNVTASSALGGISSGDLTVSNAAVTVTGVNFFTYEATASATSNDSGNLTLVTGGAVTVSSPGTGGLAPSSTFDAAIAPIRSYELIDATFEDLVTAINAYLPNNPVATAEAIGTDLATNPVLFPTYDVYPNTSAYAGSDMSGAFNLHSLEGKYSGSAGIFQYDSSNASLNNIKATVQSDDSIFPTATEATGTAYQPIGEKVQIVPTNAKTLAEWANFSAVTSLSLLANIERAGEDELVQISSREDGGDGAVKVSGVTSNLVESTVTGNASAVGDSLKVVTVSAAARSMVTGQLVKATNAIPSEILRAYRDIPEPANQTLANTTTVNTYFRSENTLKYVRVSQNIGRLIFLRNGMGALQTEPLVAADTITLTDLTNGLVQVTNAGTGILSARVGDMMYIQPGSPFPVDVRCKPIPATGRTSGVSPEYLGYPVVHVIDDDNVVVIAPNITSFGATVLTSATDLVFMPAIWNEKNIRTNHQEGAKFDLLNGDGSSYYLIKSLGNGLVSVFFQNSATEAADDMLLDTMSVNTDDYAVLGTGFDPANQGTYRIVAHNGKNHFVLYNKEGGKDEIIDLNPITNGGEGDRKWRVGPLNDGINRALRIVSADSVRIGDRLRISSPATSDQWFNDTFFGSWNIIGIGLQALDYSADFLPHTGASGTFDQEFVAPYVDFDIPNAPISIIDSSGADVEEFQIFDNDPSIGFVEGTPFTGFRMVSGSGVNTQNIENRDLFLRPKLGLSKMSSTFGTSLTALNKIGFEQRTFQGIDGYKIYSGLVQIAHRIIDGLPSNTILYPGVKAAGAIIEVQVPLIRSIQIDLQVRPKDGVTLNSIAELVKSAAAGYVNDLGEGSPVVISEIIDVVQSLPGVFSVKVIGTTPAADDDRIVVSDIEKAFVQDIDTDITVG